MINQLQTWYIITTKEKLAIKTHCLAPWSDTTDVHFKTFVCQLDRPQVEYEYHGFTITEDDKVDYFVSQMYACDLFEAKFLDDWEDSSNKL